MAGHHPNFPKNMPFVEIYQAGNEVQPRKLVMEMLVDEDAKLVKCLTYAHKSFLLKNFVASFRPGYTIDHEEVENGMEPNNRWLLSEKKYDGNYLMEIDDESWTYDGQYINYVRHFLNDKLTRIVHKHTTGYEVVEVDE